MASKTSRLALSLHSVCWVHWWILQYQFVIDKFRGMPQTVQQLIIVNFHKFLYVSRVGLGLALYFTKGTHVEFGVGSGHEISKKLRGLSMYFSERGPGQLCCKCHMSLSVRIAVLSLSRLRSGCCETGTSVTTSFPPSHLPHSTNHQWHTSGPIGARGEDINPLCTEFQGYYWWHHRSGPANNYFRGCCHRWVWSP